MQPAKRTFAEWRRATGPAMELRVFRAIQRTWAAVAGDATTALRVPPTLDTAADFIADGDFEHRFADDREAVAHLGTLDFEGRQRLVRLALSCHF